jgi:undecaprenyl diphosphate synthase
VAIGTWVEVNEFRGEIMKLYDPARKPPKFTEVPNHIAIVMDGNGRWANQRGLKRTEGHRAGELALLEVVAGAIEVGVKQLTAFAFSTENWKRSPEEVKFLMNYNIETLRARRDLLMEWGVRIRWTGQEKKLWPSVVSELRETEKLTAKNKGLTLNMAVNYGGRQEILDAAQALVDKAAAGELVGKVTEAKFAKELYLPNMPDVDLFLRSSGEMRLSNFLLWESSYAEMVFLDKLWPDFTRETLWEAISIMQGRDRRFGSAEDRPIN